MKHAVIIVAGGRGTRMNSTVPKQFLPVHKKPMLAHTLAAFDESPLIGEIVVVVPDGEASRTREEIVLKYGISKVKAVVSGGQERYDSVYAGLLALRDAHGEPKDEAGGEDAVGAGDRIILVHDGARPCVTQEIIRSACETALQMGACAAGIPEVDTVRLIEQEGETLGALLDRNRVLRVQTPQAFKQALLYEAYEKFQREPVPGITDDASLVEAMTGHKIYISRGSSRNLKVTGPEDLLMAEYFLQT